MNQAPPAEPDVVYVAIGVVRAGNAYLVGQRGPDAPLPLCAEFPGGKCLPGEQPADCVRRECLEETGIAVDVLGELERTIHEYPHGRLCLTFLLCRPCGAEQPRPPFRWVPANELLNLPFPAANQPLLARLSRETACA